MANTTVYPFGNGGTMPVPIGALTLQDNGVNFNIVNFESKDGEVDINSKRTISSLDDIAWESLTYRQIFESGFFFDAESAFSSVAVEEYLNKAQSNIPVRETTEVDSGTYSLYCEQAVGTSSCLRQTSSNTHLLELNKTYYIACRINQPTLTLTEGKTNSIVVCESEQVIKYDEVTDGWTTLSRIYKNTQSVSAKLYFGLFGNNAGTMYLDTLVCVPTDIFTIVPTKEQFDELYNQYVILKRGTAYDVEKTTQIIYAPETMPNYGFTDAECMDEFMSAMNAKAAKLGMSDSTFSNPYGGDKYGYNWTTVEDMMKMMVYATSYPRVLDYMSQNTQVDLPIYGNNARTEQYPATANSFLEGVANAYTTKHGSGTMPYLALSHKGAGWGDLNNKDATSKVRGCVGTAIVGEHHVAFCVFQASSAYVADSTYYPAIVDLLDICKAYFDTGDITGMDVANYNYAMAVELPLANPECHKNNLALNTIFLKRVLDNGSEVKFNTASASKVLSAMVMFDALGDDIFQTIDINSYDEDTDGTFWSPNDSGDFQGHAGDVFTFDTAMYGALGYSNGVFTLATARKAGGKMLYDKKLKGII